MWYIYISGNVLAWIQNFLTECTHSTRVGNYLSSIQYLTSGIIPGSCLGPKLFVLYINDIVSVFDQCCVSKLYADDLKLYMRMSIAGYTHSFQECINKLTSWSQTWQLGMSHKNVLSYKLVLLQVIVIMIITLNLFPWFKLMLLKILVFLLISHLSSTTISITLLCVPQPELT